MAAAQGRSALIGGTCVIRPGIDVGRYEALHPGCTPPCCSDLHDRQKVLPERDLCRWGPAGGGYAMDVAGGTERQGSRSYRHGWSAHREIWIREKPVSVPPAHCALGIPGAQRRHWVHATWAFGPWWWIPQHDSLEGSGMRGAELRGPPLVADLFRTEILPLVIKTELVLDSLSTGSDGQRRPATLDGKVHSARGRA
jgi:hypothetical protein